MKKTLLCCYLLMSTPLFAGTLNTFKEITDNLETGKEISVVVRDARCKMYDPNTPKIPVSTMVIKPNAVIFTENLLGFDGVKFSGTHYYPSFPNGVLQRASFMMTEFGQVNIVIAFFDAESNKKSPEVKDVRIQCQLGEGVTVYSSL